MEGQRVILDLGPNHERPEFSSFDEFQLDREELTEATNQSREIPLNPRKENREFLKQRESQSCSLSLDWAGFYCLEAEIRSLIILSIPRVIIPGDL